MARVKICGIQTLEEALLCIEAGADALGFLVGLTHKAEDKITAEKCREIVDKLPLFISKVMVTHLTDPLAVISLIKETNVDTVQLHDELPNEQIMVIKSALPHIKVVKCVHVVGNEAFEKALYHEPFVDAILVDSRTYDRLGGTGMVHDWGISAAIRRHIKKPLILAGGLNPANVIEAVHTVEPFAVDVNSGVEDAGGVKDPGKVFSFMTAAKNGGPK